MAPSADEPTKTDAEPPKARKQLPPHTIWQAVRAYCRALRTHEATTSTSSDDPDGNKSPPAANDDGPAKKDDGGSKDEPTPTWISAHGQATMDTQTHPGFNAPYTGPLSLLPVRETDTSLTATLYLAARFWETDHYTADVVFNPELAGGQGFSGVNGLAGLTDGDLTRVGVATPTPYFARLFLRQTWGFGGEQETVEDAANQIAGKRDVDRFTLIVGKFSFTDVIDNNLYSHDPRTQMQNWSLMFNGPWDYPANVRGYTYGAAVDYNQKDWAFRYGITAEPEIANGAPLDPHIAKAQGQAAELEARWGLDDHPGRVRLMTYLNHANMGNYREALEESPKNPNINATQSYRYKYGCDLNAEQELMRDLGAWCRLGWNDGRSQTWAFTPIDRTAAIGLLLKGRGWARPADEVGVAGVLNGLAQDHRAYLAAGGLDFNIGDGRLNYGLEKIVEVYYRIAVTKMISINIDFQEIADPAYNRDRGPVSVESLMVHFEF